MSVPTGRIEGKKFTEEFGEYVVTDDQEAAKEYYLENEDYRLADEDVDLEDVTQITESDSFILYVPEHCKKNIPFGLYIHISPNNNSMIPGGYEKIFDKANIICASPKGAGNDINGFRRMVLALSCVATVKHQYSIDEKRIYVGGFSGVGGMSLTTHLLYPDLFKGTISHAKNMYIGKTEHPEKEGRYYSKGPSYISDNRLETIADKGHRWIFFVRQR